MTSFRYAAHGQVVQGGMPLTACNSRQDGLKTAWDVGVVAAAVHTHVEHKQIDVVTIHDNFRWYLFKRH